MFTANLKILEEIYPRYMIMLVLLPIIIGFMINYDLSDSLSIFISFLWIPIFTIPFSLFQKKIIYQTAIVIYFIMGFVEISHWVLLKGPITITSLLVASNTNYQEASEFMDLKATSNLFILIPYTLFSIYAFRNPPKHNKSKNKLYLTGLILLILAGFSTACYIKGNNVFIRKGVPQFVRVMYSFGNEISLYKKAIKEFKVHKIDAKASSTYNLQTFVLIIGESCSRNHMSLYDTLKKTNPKLENRNDIIIYDNVISPYSTTIKNILTVLSQKNLENNLSIDKSRDIIDIFSSAGFKTYWISNQSPIGIWDNLITAFAKKSDYSKFVNTSSNSSLESLSKRSYDSKLFEPFSLVLKENVDKKFIVLHLMGSHSYYSKRYPAEFNIFKENDSKEKIIAEYKNSVLYNDYIVDSLFNILDYENSHKKDFVASAIYLSDHGENVFDEFGKIGHDYSKTLPKSNVEIPFLVWLSPGYAKFNAQKVVTIDTNKSKPFVSDDLFHSIIDINNIQSSYFEKERSIFNEKFNDQRIRILVDGNDYDKN